MEESKLKIGLDARKGFFHVMLSYRVTPDADFVTKIHDKLHLLAPTAGKSVSQVNQLLDSSDSPFPEGFRRDESTLNSSLHVFQDYYCLRDGVGWEGDGGIKSGGFVGALRLSAVFVPIFSATDIVTENSESAQKRSGKGSVGQMIKLAHEDVQDNVLLELIVARELHLISRTINKTNGNKVLSPCSYIIPLFRQDVWACKAVDFLPETASAITNAKAKNVMKLMEVPDEAISPELRNGTLTVRAVWEFFLQFQGKKLYEHGKENFQVVAAANAIISVIDGVRQFVAESKFDDLKMNSSQMHELSNFLLQLNMSNYTAIFASHQITNVFQLAEMKQPISDALVLSIAQYGVRESDNSTLPVELSKIGAAIRAAQSSPLATSLNVRLRNFIDRDASFVTLLSSSSLFDLVLSKKFSALSVFLIMSIILIDQVSRLVSPDIIPNRPRIHRHLDYFASTVPNILAALACLIAVFHSPRKGRFCLAFAFLNWASIVTVMFAVGAYSAIYENCANCYGEARILNQLTTVQRIGVQPTWFLMYWGLFFCSLFKQQWTFPVLFLAQIINILIYYPSLGSLAIEFLEGSGFYVYVFTWFSFFVLLSFLQYIGNRRAGFIFELNSRAVEGAYQTLLRDEISKSSQFGKLCSNQQPSQEYEMRPYPHVVYVSDSEQHSTIQGQCVDAPLVTPTPAGHSAPSQTSVKSQKIISIENMFKTEYTLHGELLQVQHSFEQLIQDAEFINDAFQVWVSCWLIGGPDLDVVHKYLHQPAQFKDLIERTSAPIKGICIRGPLKHVDRCIAKLLVYKKFLNIITLRRISGLSLQSFLTAITQAYRAYSGDFKRLTDIVRCCLVVDTTDDMLTLVKKILDNSNQLDACKPSVMKKISLMWNYFEQNVLGLKPIPVLKENDSQDNTNDQDEGVFKLLRVRNRFATSNSVGGYRDMNFKIRVGFKCDSKKGQPLFCSVKHWHEPDVKTIVVEIQVQLKELHKKMDNMSFHNNYIIARNLMSQ